MHASDRERFRLMLWSLQEKQGGDLQTDFRLQRQDGTYLWYDLRAHAAPSENARLHALRRPDARHHRLEALA